MRAIALPVLCVSTTAAAAPNLALHYAPLFEKGKTFTYALSVTNFDYIEKKNGTFKSVKMKPELSTFTCNVTAVIGAPRRDRVHDPL